MLEQSRPLAEPVDLLVVLALTTISMFSLLRIIVKVLLKIDEKRVDCIQKRRSMSINLEASQQDLLLPKDDVGTDFDDDDNRFE
jgi:hypothetical protein